MALASTARAFYEARVLWNVLLGVLAGLSAALGLWQWLAALRFPLHRRQASSGLRPGVSVLKPLKGSDAFTSACLRSWLEGDYKGPVQLLFGVASAADPVCEVVRTLLRQFPEADASLVMCPDDLGSNAKVSTLIQLRRQARHPIIAVSDADVRVPPDLLENAVQLFQQEAVGVVSCFYRLANPTTLAMRCEAVAINADFWSQVLQSNSLKPMDFALGAVMVVREAALETIGGFGVLSDCLADDYQLGNRVVRQGFRSAVCPVVVECWDPPQGWRRVWKHQLRWARTIRVCQPVPYFFSILSNATFWPVLWGAALPSLTSLIGAAGFVLLRILLAVHLQARLTPDKRHLPWFWLIPLKDLVAVVIWVGAFLGNTIEWRGQRKQLLPDGTLRD